MDRERVEVLRALAYQWLAADNENDQNRGKLLLLCTFILLAPPETAEAIDALKPIAQRFKDRYEQIPIADNAAAAFLISGELLAWDGILNAPPEGKE